MVVEKQGSYQVTSAHGSVNNPSAGKQADRSVPRQKARFHMGQTRPGQGFPISMSGLDTAATGVSSPWCHGMAVFGRLPSYLYNRPRVALLNQSDLTWKLDASTPSEGGGL